MTSRTLLSLAAVAALLAGPAFAQTPAAQAQTPAASTAPAAQSSAAVKTIHKTAHKTAIKKVRHLRPAHRKARLRVAAKTVRTVKPATAVKSGART